MGFVLRFRERTLRPTLLFLVLGIPYYSTALTAAHPANHPFCCCRHNIHPPSGRGILRSSDAGSCIDRPPALRGSPLSAVPPLSGGTHVVVPDKDAEIRIASSR